MTPKDLLTNKYFCPMPFAGLMYNHDGSVKNCIRSAGKLGNIKDNTIEEILHSATNIDTQQNMLAKKPGESCYTCYELENDKKSFDIISDRVFYIKELRHVPLETYRPDNHQLSTIDVRWSNLCNFACVYCGPEYSSRWAKEINANIDTPNQQQFDNFKKYIFDNVDQLTHVYLAGGEPLLMKQNLELLDALSEHNPNVTLRINTNLSKVDTRVFDRVCEFANVHWTVSVESMEAEFEYIRHGGSWADFVENLSRIKQLNHKITFNMLHFLLNYRSIFGCVDWLQSQGFHPNSFVIGALLQPDYLNIRHLPDSTLQQVRQQLEHRLSQKQGYLLDDSYTNMLHYINKPAVKNLQRSFDQLAELDQRRSLDSKKIFTDLYKEHYHGKTI